MRGALLTAIGGAFLTLVGVLSFGADEVSDTALVLYVVGGVCFVTEVRGHGRQKGHIAVYRGKEYNVSLLPKMMIEVVVEDARAEEVVHGIAAAARTGEIGDGRVFVMIVDASYKIRTGEQEVD